MIEITSLQNEKIKKIVKLRDRNKRDKEDLFVIEGYREIIRAFNSNVELESFFYSPELFLGENEDKLISQIENKKIETFKCTKEVFQKISYRDRPDGLIAIAKKRELGIDALKKILEKKKSPFLVIAESIEKPGNLGTILRSSDGAGVDAVIICDPKTDIFNPNVIRASIGTLFTQPVIVADADETIALLKEMGVQIVSTTPHTDKMYSDADLKKGIAIVVGTEQYGLSETWLKLADIKIKIPMYGIADSLNVGAATTIVLYEAVRQRKLS